MIVKVVGISGYFLVLLEIDKRGGREGKAGCASAEPNSAQFLQGKRGRRADQLGSTGSVDRAKASADPTGQSQQEEEEEHHKCVFINRTGETAR